MLWFLLVAVEVNSKRGLLSCLNEVIVLNFVLSLGLHDCEASEGMKNIFKGYVFLLSSGVTNQQPSTSLTAYKDDADVDTMPVTRSTLGITC